MRDKPTDIVEQYRITHGEFASGHGDRNGAFIVRGWELLPATGGDVSIIASDGYGWDHVSVSGDKIPRWHVMAWVKDQFWDDTEAVMQLHVPASQHVNNMSRCLHLWRPQGVEIPLPPSWMVGLKELGKLK